MLHTKKDGENMYRVIYWVNDDMRFTAPTHYSDAYDTAVMRDGIVVKEVIDVRKMKEMNNG
jgi:hypothetical protein